MKKILKFILIFLLILSSSIIIVYLFYTVKWKINTYNNKSLLGEKVPKIEFEGKTYRDLNKNGKLDVYENFSFSIEERVEDLISQMTIEEKAGSMFITMIGVNNDGTLMESPSFSDPFSFLMNSSSEMIAKKSMNHFNIRASHEKEKMLEWHNKVQDMGSRTRLGIPITIATDPRHGTSKDFGATIYTPYFSSWPSALGMGAINDSILTKEFGKIVREEYKSLGIRLALGPMADTSTEPRWARVNGTFGENAELNARLIAAYITGLQGDRLDKSSVAAMVKHFPGSGPVDGGKDSHFPPGLQSYKGNNFDYHLIPFKAAFDVGTASVMPLYSVPKGITSEDVAAGYNRDIITGLIRNKYNFDGIICTDWGLISDFKLLGMMFKPASAHGVEHLSTDQRLIKIIEAGVDMIGGENLTEELANLIKGGKIKESRINLSLKRIFKQKFKLGLFDNPYLEENSLLSLDNKKNIEMGKLAQRKSLVLLKNTGILPLDPNSKIYIYGFDDNLTKKINKVSLEEAEVIVAKVKTPSWGEKNGESIMEKLFSGGRLDFQKKELDNLLPIFESKPTILVANLRRPSVLTEFEKVSKALIADFDVSNNVIFELIFGEFNPTGKLPIQLPSSMKSVENQIEDLPFDLDKPLFNYGHGLSF